MNKILWAVLGVMILWVIIGNPGESITGWFWPRSAAPWENVHAFYYPDRNYLSIDRRLLNLGSLQACRDWANEQSRADGDFDHLRSDYECGVGCKTLYGDMFVCRLTIE